MRHYLHGLLALAAAATALASCGGRTTPAATSHSGAITTEYVAPQRIMAAEAVEHAERLLEDIPIQLTHTPSDTVAVFNPGKRERSSILLDFGREMQGGVRISAAERPSKQPLKVRLVFGESVSEAASDFNAPRTTATNDHAMRDLTCEIPWFGYTETGNTGFRFLRIELLDKNAALPVRCIRAASRKRDIPYLGSFESSDPRLNRIWQTAAYTVHLNMQEYLWDGIKRDRLVWLGDSHPEVMTISTVFGDNPVVRESVDLARDNAPLPKWINNIPSYSMWWIIVQHDLYMYRGGLDYLRQQQRYMLELSRILASQINADGSEAIKGRHFLDWPSSELPEVVHSGYQALLTITMRDAMQIAEWTGSAELKEVCSAALGKLARYKPAHHNNKQAAALLALARIITPEEAAKVLSAGGADGFSTFYGYYMLEAMALAGDYEGAMRIISDYWGRMIDLGATSFWEDLKYSDGLRAARIDEFVPEGAFDIHKDGGAYCYVGLRHSFCHGWASGPAPWLTAHILGLRPVEPGCRTVEFSPHLGKLAWVKGTLPTPYGIITASCSRTSDGRLATTIDAPRGVKIVRREPSG
jgi:alpha-L-rhamnosidase